ncbi:putative leucine-rich repeat-containing protein DDB_G0290503 [Gouania willdenowi]|uniref:putative leucine-rich repeat-containing protein DDB_G0290503 n=1 Tax=Gouania willdenowi TaxID=441366 RepID=UPI001055BB0C|nr:putative leucine-rich repeat-containing protein DDB_G0290503 [Gouania willdenowi]XP_028298807.1 putative leucine-rich repeat-containing protein DDB_G0290503 [Gouania willdenowi]
MDRKSPYSKPPQKGIKVKPAGQKQSAAVVAPKVVVKASTPKRVQSSSLQAQKKKNHAKIIQEKNYLEGKDLLISEMKATLEKMESDLKIQKDQCNQLVENNKILEETHSNYVSQSQQSLVQLQTKLDNAERELQAKNAKIADLKATLTQTEDLLTQTQDKFSRTEDLHTQTQNLLTQMEKDLTQTKDTLTQTEDNLTQTQKFLTQNKFELTQTQSYYHQSQDTIRSMMQEKQEKDSQVKSFLKRFRQVRGAERI